MDLSNEQIAEAFSRHRFDRTYDYLADTIQWDVIGGERIDGKEQVVAACRQSVAYLADVVTTFGKFRLVVGEGCVVIDSEAEYRGKDGDVSKVASCDLYDFSAGKLTKITSYTVELP